MAAADSVLKIVSENYINLRDSVQSNLNRNIELDSKGTTHKQRKILVNIPYKDQWFIPGQESYLTTLFKDAGGEILGAKSGSSVSGQISVETAYSLSKEADLWMNVGWCQTLEQLLSVNPLFDDFLMDIQGNASARGYPMPEDAPRTPVTPPQAWSGTTTTASTPRVATISGKVVWYTPTSFSATSSEYSAAKTTVLLSITNQSSSQTHPAFNNIFLS